MIVLVSLTADYIFINLYADHPDLYKDRGVQADGTGTKSTENSSTEGVGQRQAATDEFMLERFRKRERQRVMRR